jgi:hypothetical protein
MAITSIFPKAPQAGRFELGQAKERPHAPHDVVLVHKGVVRLYGHVNSSCRNPVSMLKKEDAPCVETPCYVFWASARRHRFRPRTSNPIWEATRDSQKDTKIRDEPTTHYGKEQRKGQRNEDRDSET